MAVDRWQVGRFTGTLLAKKGGSGGTFQVELDRWLGWYQIGFQDCRIKQVGATQSMQGIFMLGTAIEVKCDGKWENKGRIKIK